MNSDGTVTNENPSKPAASHVAKRAGDNEVPQPPPKRPLQVTSFKLAKLFNSKITNESSFIPIILWKRTKEPLSE